MSINAMVICPVKPGLNPVLLENQKRLIEAATAYAEQFDMRLHVMYGDFAPPWAPPVKSHADRARHISSIRNAMILEVATAVGLHTALADLTHVIWMDADVVRYPEDLFYRLLDISDKHNAVTAPKVLLDDTNGRTPPGRWYDTAGFIHKGQRAGLWFPYFLGERNDKPLPELMELDGSVGCVYCVPWRVYAEGACHHFDTETTTEHYSVCQHARRMGLKLLVLTEAAAYHAYLPDYGEAFH